MYNIYVLVFSDDEIYVGMTKNLKQRLKDHKRGHTKSTKNREIKMVFKIETCLTRIKARSREKYWKSGCGKEILKSRTVSSAG